MSNQNAPSRIAIDTHTHTVISGHAWSTLEENIAAGQRVGLKGLVVTDHAFSIPGTITQLAPDSYHMLPSEVDGFLLFYGMEFNIFDRDGTIDPYSQKSLDQVQFGIASLHNQCFTPATSADHTDAYIAALSHPTIDIVGHPGSPVYPCDVEAVVAAARKQNKLIEINNNSFVVRTGCHDNCLAFARECKKQGVRVSVSSDAHFSRSVGRVELAWQVIEEAEFPSELIVNLTAERFQAFLAERTAEKLLS